MCPRRALGLQLQLILSQWKSSRENKVEETHLEKLLSCTSTLQVLTTKVFVHPAARWHGSPGDKKRRSSKSATSFRAEIPVTTDD